ncbi:MAG: ATP-binding protein [Chthoniobacterales bacterium]
MSRSGKSRPQKTKAAASDKGGTQNKLRASEEQFRLLVESVEEYAIYLLDPDGNVSTWNLGAEKLKGYRAEEIIGKNFSCFYTDEDLAARKPQRNLSAALRLGHIRDQGARVRKDGSIFQAEVVLTALRDKSGKMRGFSKVTRDITEQMRNREIEAAKIAAEKASKAKDDFLAALSHELRTPLTPTLAAASYLSINASRLSPEFTDEIDTIQRNVQLQARLIDDLLDLTRAVRGKLELHFDRVDAHALVRDALEIARPDIISKKLRVSTKCDAKKHHIWADPVRVQQVFWNLINNAVKFTPDGGKIDISTRNAPGNHFEFAIRDNGIGIEAAKLEALFKPFEQGGAEITRQFGGLGLGLAISKHLMDLHDGAIEVSSAGRACGSTFRVRLAVMARQDKSDAKPKRQRQRPRRTLRILLVEDHGDTRRILARLLAHFGHQIAVADCQQSALEMLRSRPFDVVLSDISLPDGSGYDVISEAKRDHHVAGIALTGYGTDEDIRRGKAAGFDFHLTKPVDFHELRTVLDQLDSK